MYAKNDGNDLAVREEKKTILPMTTPEFNCSEMNFIFFTRSHFSKFYYCVGMKMVKIGITIGKAVHHNSSNRNRTAAF